MAPDAIGECRKISLVHSEAPCMRATRSDTPVDFGFREMAAGSRVGGLVARHLRRADRGLNVLAAAEARIDDPGRPKRRERGVIAARPCRLRVRAERTAGVRTLVPIEPEPMEIVQ